MLFLVVRVELDVVIIKVMRKRVFFFLNINSKIEIVIEVGYVVCGFLRMSDVFIFVVLFFLGLNRFFVSFYCMLVNVWIVWIILF